MKEGAKQGRATDEVGTEQTKNKIIKKKSSKWNVKRKSRKELIGHGETDLNSAQFVAYFQTY